MVNPLDVAKAVVTAVAGPVPVAIIDAHTQSNQNNDRDSNRRKDAEDYWNADRQIIDNEWGRLDPQYHQPAPNKILSPKRSKPGRINRFGKRSMVMVGSWVSSSPISMPVPTAGGA